MCQHGSSAVLCRNHPRFDRIIRAAIPKQSIANTPGTYSNELESALPLLFLVTGLVPRPLPRFGLKPLKIVGAALNVLFLLSFTQLNVNTNFFPIPMIPILLLGFGAGLAFGPMSVTILSSVERREPGSASGLMQTTQQAGGSLGLAELVTRFGFSTCNAANTVFEGLMLEMCEHAIAANAMEDAFQIAISIAANVLLVTIFVIKPVRVRPNELRSAAHFDGVRSCEYP